VGKSKRKVTKTKKLVLPGLDEIDKEIEILEGLKDRLGEQAGLDFRCGPSIDAQIEVLKEDLDNNAIWDHWPHETKDIDTRMAADDARGWLDYGGDPPSKGWLKDLK